jgi:NitT/TauT family transport system permease protein
VSAAEPTAGSTPLQSTASLGSAPTLRTPLTAARALRWARSALQRSAAVGSLALLWELAPRLGFTERAFLPPLSEVLAATGELARSGQLWEHVSASAARALVGLLLALLYALPLGLAVGWYRSASELLSPLIEILRNTAALALLPVFILLLGIGETSKVALVTYACSWPILLNAIAGVKQVDPLLIRCARTLALSPARLFAQVILPAALPTLFVGIRLAGAASVLVLVAAEMIGAKAGLGYLVINAQYNFQIPQMYAGILAITALGLALNELLRRLEAHFTRWRPQAEAQR